MATIKFNANLTETDPKYHPVLIIGQVSHLSLLTYDHVKSKLANHVSSDTLETAIKSLHPSPTDACSLYLNLATVAALPLQCSRHNTNSRAHAVTRLVKAHSKNITESIVIVCEKSDLYASACAVVRAYPTFSRKTSSKSTNATETNGGGKIDTKINVEFIIIVNGSISTSGQTLSVQDVQCLTDAAYGIRLTAKIVDAPCSEMNVTHFINEINTVATELNLIPTIIRGEELNAQGFGGIYGVGKAAAVPPALVVLSHRPASGGGGVGTKKTIAWVGKGIVYDTGGLSIKTKTGMPGMKRDCGGAAAILGGFYAAVKAGFNENLHAVFCLAENSVGPNATRPDDIHTLFSGKTVEINNTDAEGRLVLSDGVAYAQKILNADIILDMATLTGAQGIATGKYHGAILTNDEDWELKSIEAGRASGDLLSPIVYCPELHFSEFNSAMADMKNSVGDRANAQSSCAGLFIASNLGFDYSGSWIHIDMASPVHCGERATGYGVALLSAMFGNYTESKLLQSIAPVGGDEENSAKRVRRG